jgi:hypothetical protein
MSRGRRGHYASAYHHHAEHDRGNAKDQHQIVATVSTTPTLDFPRLGRHGLPTPTGGPMNDRGLRGHGAPLQGERRGQSCTVGLGIAAHHVHVTRGLTELSRRLIAWVGMGP